tara:strand:+ start:512 stop:1291 length:780 start_codon:yes stop_codon:yes gene_type:complete
MISVLFVGYGNDQSYYEKLRFKFGSGVQFSWFDNKSGIGKVGDNQFIFSDGNILYEFSGYLYLLQKFSEYNPKSSSSVIWLVNDTLVNHHAFPLWRKIVKNSISQLLPFSILADVRSARDSYGPYKYAASWMYIFRTEELSKFYGSLEGAIRLGHAHRKYYEGVRKKDYGRHLDDVKRSRLLKWLFSKKIFKGWQYSQKFENTPTEIRVRKGICIEMETYFSSELVSSGFSIVDLKSGYRGFILSAADRFITFLLKLKR